MSESMKGARNLSGGRSDAPNGDGTEAETLEALAARVQALEQQLRATEERYQQIFNNAHDIVYVLNMDGAFMTVNATALRLTGFTLDEVQGRPYSTVVAPEYLEVTRENIRRKLAGAGPTTYEIEL